MKILCVADESDPLVYSPNIAERYKDIDFVIAAGDLPLSYYEYIVTSLNKPLYFVFGNHHLDDLSKYRRKTYFEETPSIRFLDEHYARTTGGEYIDGKVMRDRNTGLLLAGLGGSMRYNNGEHQFSEFQMTLRILRIIPRLVFNRLRYGRWLDILITHAPPNGIGDQSDLCHTGFKVFLWFMRRFRPRYLLHGHVHLIDINLPRSIEYEHTEVINVYGSYVLERT